MRIQNGSFPHPVLGLGDDVGSSFQVSEFHTDHGVDEIKVTFRVKHNCADLTRLIGDGQAAVQVRWTCSSTMSAGSLPLNRTRNHPDGMTLEGFLDQQDIRDQVDLEFSVVALRDIPGFSWEKQHEDYGDQTFDIRKGDYLALGGESSFKADKLFDPMSPPLGSCFKIVPDPSVRRGTIIRFDDPNHVVIAMPEETAHALAGLGGRTDLQISLVVLPALMATISFIQRAEAQSNLEEIAEFDWYETVHRLMMSNKADYSQPFEAAQKILENPIDKVLSNPLFDEED